MHMMEKIVINCHSLSQNSKKQLIMNPSCLTLAGHI